MHKGRATISTLGLALLSPTIMQAQANMSQVKALGKICDCRAPILRMADELERDYVYPAVGRSYAKMLRENVKHGRYAGCAEPEALSKTLTEDLKTISYDRHLRVRPVRDDPSGGSAPVDGSPTSKPGTPTQNSVPLRPSAVDDARWITPGVAYIRFNLFPGDTDTLDYVRRFMVEHASARSLIIDARGHHGGGIDEMNVILPYLYAESTILVDMSVAEDVVKDQGFPIPESEFFRKVQGLSGFVQYEHRVVPNGSEHRLRKAKVFYLTSAKTGSAAEHLALAFKRTHRATLIGERTGGANHFGGFVPIGEGLEFFLPMGRTFDPATGKDWEGIGIAPDIAVPADQALSVALKLA